MPRPGEPVVREKIYHEIGDDDTQDVPGRSRMTMEDYIKWCEERGLPCNVTPTEDLQDVEPEEIIFHSPLFPASNDFEGSWATVESVRMALHEPYPVPRMPLLFDIKECGDKGKGMFAKVDIAPGFAILFEHPVILVLRAIRGVPSGTIFKLLTERLQPSLLQQLMALSNCKTPEEAGPVEGILRTNAFMVELDGGTIKDWRDHSAVFLQISRCNHSCSPNASYKWDQHTYSMRLFAIRPIAAGEEITITYTSLEAPRETRRQRLKLMYKFDCACQSCNIRGEQAIRESDARRKYSATWRYDPAAPMPFATWFELPVWQAPPVKDVISSWQRVVELHEKEGLRVPPDALDTIASMYAVIGDEAKYRMWALKALDGIRIEGMHTANQSELAVFHRYQKAIQNPKVIPFWGTRVA